MEIKKEDFELFIQFKQFMATQGSMEFSRDVNKKPRREKGTGSVTRLSGKRKRPYLASVTIGYDEYNGKQIQKPLAYFIDSKQADKALDIYNLEKDGKCDTGTLLEYIHSVDGKMSKNCNFITQNIGVIKKNNVNSNTDCPTFKEIWIKVLNSDLSHLTTNSYRNYKVSFNHLKELHDRKIDTIKLADVQPYFDELMAQGTGKGKMNNMKIVLNAIFKYAMKYDWIEKNYAEFIEFKETINENDKRTKVPYSKDQIKNLFKHDNDIIVQSILVMIYTGMRPSELLQLKKENVFLNERYMIGGIKTKNGINRIIPIHESIIQYVKNILDSKLLGMSYYTYINYFNVVKKKMNFKCTPHSGRHTFASLANEYNLNEFLLKKIMGHSAKDLTKDVYTHIDKERLINEVNKIPTLK